MHKLTEQSKPKPRKAKRKPRTPKPPAVEQAPVTTEVTPDANDALDVYLEKFNARFGLDVSKDGLAKSQTRVLDYLARMKFEIPEPQWGLMLHDSIDYAVYRIAQKFGVLPQDSEDNPLLRYGSVKSRFIEVMERF